MDYQCYNCKNCSTPICSRETTPFSKLECSATSGHDVRAAATVGECIDYDPLDMDMPENSCLG